MLCSCVLRRRADCGTTFSNNRHHDWRIGIRPLAVDGQESARIKNISLAGCGGGCGERRVLPSISRRFYLSTLVVFGLILVTFSPT